MWQDTYREHGHELPIDRWTAGIGTLEGFDPLQALQELVGTLDTTEVERRQRNRLQALVVLQGLRPGIGEYLTDARQLGLRTAIVSSASREWIDSHLIRLRQADCFDAVVCADGDPARAKPRPLLYLEALARLDVDASEAIAIEDSLNGVRAAKAAGIYTVAVPNPATAQLDLGEADLIVSSLAALPVRTLLRKARPAF